MESSLRPSKAPDIYRKDEKLSAWGFRLGYIERQENEENSAEIFREHAVYHVRKFIKGVRVWETFTNLNEARQTFNRFKRDIT